MKRVNALSPEYNEHNKFEKETKLTMHKVNIMKESIKAELEQHVQDLINDGVLTEENRDDWHFHAFNEDYYLIGYYQCEQWLKQHGVSAFEAIETIREYEQDNFGEVSTKFDNAESVVNMYVYILGKEIIYGMGY